MVDKQIIGVVMKKHCITADQSLLECLYAIDRAGTGIILVVDEDFRLIGTISDGDIRRAILKGHGLETPLAPHIERDCFSVSPAMSRNEILDIMQSQLIEQVPIVDEISGGRGRWFHSHSSGTNKTFPPGTTSATGHSSTLPSQ